MTIHHLRFALPCALALALAACERSPNSGTRPAAGPTADGQSVVVTARDPRNDDRIRHLIGPCARRDPYLEDTSDLVPVFVSKLSGGNVDPQRRAREDLAAIGTPALDALERLFRESYGEQFLAQRVQNVVEVLTWMPPTERAHALVLEALRHPQESIRKSAARALTRIGTAADYDELAAMLPLSGSDSQGDLQLAMLATDRARLEREFTEALETGKDPERVKFLATHLCTTRDPEILARWRAALSKAGARESVYLRAALAKNGDVAALEDIRRDLTTKGNPTLRQMLAQALTTVGMGRELLPLLVQVDPDDALRKGAVEALGNEPDDPTVRDALRTALADPLQDVRDVALTTLVVRGDASAVDTALQFLLGTRDEFESGLRAVLAACRHDPSFAKRVFETLRAVHRGEAGSGRVDERTLVRAIGQLPSEEAARYVMECWKDGAPDIQDLPAHRWYAQAASNTAPIGMPYLRGRHAAEGDPLRRMDLVMAISAYKNDDVRAFLLAALEDPRATPAEVLYVAERCANFGPGPQMAPALKRVALRIDDPLVRPALNCLLWDFYGPSR